MPHTTKSALRTVAMGAIACLTLAGAAWAAPGAGPHGRMGDGAPGAERMMRNLFDRFDLSAEQRTTIETIVATHRTETAALHEALGVARDALADVTYRAPLDEGAVREAARTAANIEVELAVERAVVHASIANVLTPEQAAELREMREHRKERMERRGPRRGARRF